MSIEPITRLQRFLRVLADSSADMPEPLRNLEKCCCYACGHLDTRPELHTTLEKLIASVRDKSIVPPKPNTRLEKYVAARAGVWDDELPEPITREDKILFEAASGEDVTLSGNPLMLENCIGGKALKALHVYGKSTQDGTPTPDAPVPIVSAGDGGTIAVTLSNGNGKTQTLTLPTPNGLPGIPVTSGGNYTDPSGQQWVCDEVDLQRGVKVQRVNVVDVSTCLMTGISELAATKRVTYILSLSGRATDTKALCNKLQFIVSFIQDSPHFYIDVSRVQIFIPIDAKIPEEGEYILFYALATPIETPLTPAEIAAYKALTTYAPDTVVQASDGAGVEATYKCNVRKAEKTINDLYAELTAELEA